MAIVEGKTGMQVGNMPSIDAVSQDGFIIYSDDGIHTYKMTIAEFAQAIGVVMTGGGDGDGGDGLLYWKEESQRIFRDIMSTNENEFRTINNGNVFRTLVNNYWVFTTDGEDHSVNQGSLTIHPKYNGNNMWPDDFKTSIAMCERFPALDSLFTMPDSKYYCNYTNPADRAVVPYSKLRSWQTYDDIIVNPPIYISEPTYITGQSEPVGLYEEQISRIDCGGQDRRFFGYINLNVNKTVKIQNPTYDYGFEQNRLVMGYFTGDSAEAIEGQANARKSQAKFVEDDYPVTGTAEYIFSLYCIGHPNEKAVGHYLDNHANDHEFEYYPWKAISQGYYRYPYRWNIVTDRIINLEEWNEPPIGNELYPQSPLNQLYIQDKKTGRWASPYYRPLRKTNPASEPPAYSNELNNEISQVTFLDKSDIGAAYFTDDEGTLWYVVLTPRTRASKSYWDEQNRVEPSIITNDPSDFDKAPQYLQLDQTYTHWCYDGSDSLDDYNFGDGGWIISPRYRENLGDWYGVYGGYGYSLKSEKLEIYEERIGVIGKAILNALGLKGIKPLKLSAGGVHSEIAASMDSVLNGGKYYANGTYAKTYDLNPIDGSFWLAGDAYDNGKKLKDVYQKKLTAGEGIEIEIDQETGDLVISSDGGGGSGSVDIVADADSSGNVDITGFGEKKIRFVGGGGAIMELLSGYDGRGSNKTIALRPLLNAQSAYGELLIGYSPTYGYATIDIKRPYSETTQRVLKGSEHVYISESGKNSLGHNPNYASGSVFDTIFTDCIDTISIGGTALPKQHVNKSYSVDIPAERVLPTVTAADAGKVLTVDANGNWVLDYPSNI